MIDPEDLYNTLLERFSQSELEAKIKKKRTEFKDTMGVPGILFLIAREEGIQVPDQHLPSHEFRNPSAGTYDYTEEIDLNEFTLSIEQIQEGMNTVVAIGRISDVNPIRHFTRKDGTPGVVGSFELVDDTGEIKVVVWGEKVKILETEFFTMDTLVRVIADYSRLNDNEFYGGLELHVGRKGDIQMEPQDLDPDRIPKPLTEQEPISSTQEGKGTAIPIQAVRKKKGYFHGSIAGTILGPPEFKRIEKKKAGKVYFLLTLLLSDETSAITVNMWGERAQKLQDILTPDLAIKLTNLRIQKNSYTQDIEATLVKTSRLSFLG